MSSDVLDAIPVEHRELARSALASAFGAAPVTDWQRLSRGSGRPLLYRIEVADRPYLLRVETGRDVFRDPHRGYACMQIAADAGLAPPLRHADPSTGVAIMDFLPERPLLTYPSGFGGLVRDLGGLVARLQATPRFPPLADYLVILDGMLGYLRSSGLFAAGLLDPHVEGFERIHQVYPWDSTALVSGHNDLNPNNILFDGERLWLIDWELAFCNDPLVDVATLVNYFAVTPELGEALLHGWLGRAPDRATRSRLVLARQLTRLFYGCIILTISVGNHAQETDLTVMSLAEIHARVAAGQQSIDTPESRHAYGKAYLAAFLEGLAATEFKDALEIVPHG